ncbi:helix-turn-helix domain-containing protein [Streptomyces sp. HUAS TT3]|uniref:helix-turn-helix domain-containing protein n=1 Tax=Streptomyces sp. HUAS TT3 TaxID=3447510 RepID=UPI003F65D941
MKSNDGKEREPAGVPSADAPTDEERWALALEQAPTFGEALGARMRQVREGNGRTAEDVAKSARHYGLSWHRPTVGQIEQGQRSLSAVELIMLPAIYSVPLNELLPDETVWLTSELGVYGREVRRVLGGDYHPPYRALFAPGGWYLKGSSDQDPTETAVRVAKAAAELWRRNSWPAHAAAQHTQETPDEAEAKAAKRLGTTAHYVAYAARDTWGRGLAAEREARLRERGELPEGKRALQSARGHITRALVAELEPVVKVYEAEREREGREEAENFDPSEIALTPEERKKRREANG